MLIILFKKKYITKKEKKLYIKFYVKVLQALPHAIYIIYFIKKRY